MIGKRKKKQQPAHEEPAEAHQVDLSEAIDAALSEAPQAEEPVTVQEAAHEEPAPEVQEEASSSKPKGKAKVPTRYSKFGGE